MQARRDLYRPITDANKALNKAGRLAKKAVLASEHIASQIDK